MKPSVLAVCPYYVPGYRAGGPVRSVENLVRRLSNEFDFRVLTADRDFLSDARYPEVRLGEWVRVGEAKVRYLAPEEWGRTFLRRAIAEAEPSLVYLNSFFHPHAAQKLLWTRRRGEFREIPFIVAPRGEFGEGALAIKAWKKRPCLAICRAARVLKGLVWQASTEFERADIRRCAGSDAEVFVASDLPSQPSTDVATRSPKTPGTLQVVMLGRVTRMKNVDFAIRALAAAKSEMRLRVAGPLEDPGYVAECRSLASSLGSEKSVEFLDFVAPPELQNLLSEAHVLLHPSRGENFGHSIPEALAAGCPVLTSDRTPWRDLEAREAGWTLPLDEAAFAEKLSRLACMTDSEYQVWSSGASRYGREILEDSAAEEANRQMFHAALGLRPVSDREPVLT